MGRLITRNRTRRSKRRVTGAPTFARTKTSRMHPPALETDMSSHVRSSRPPAVHAADVEPLTRAPFPNMVWIPGGTFRMGSDRHYAEEAPAREVTVGGFWMDEFPVTNGQYDRF